MERKERKRRAKGLESRERRVVVGWCGMCARSAYMHVTAKEARVDMGAQSDKATQQAAASNQLPTTSSQELAASSQQPAASHQQPATSSQ